jgi:UDP-GlcNAc:undecaprenyl-phosphate/decaprenyl-phosphate GlcNAc-1-phosphate transferase
VGIVVTALLLPVAARLAVRTGAVARPRADRLGSRTVPMLGGVAIVGGILAGAGVGLAGRADLLPILLGILALAVLGLVDDLATIGPLPRLAVQSLVAVAFVAVVTAGLDPVIRGVAIVVAAVAVPLAINATNLVDNADGLATSLSIVTALTLAALGVATGLTDQPILLGIVIAASGLVFLALRNRPPARMFMGDVGSLALGFALAAVTILVVRDAITGATSGLIAALLFPLAWGVQLADLAMVFVTRARRGLSPFRGGVDHTSHRLLLLGWTPVSMLVTLAGTSAALGAVAVAVALTQSAPLAVVAVLGGAVLLAGAETALVRRTEGRVRADAVAAAAEATEVAEGGTVAGAAEAETPDDADHRAAAVATDTRPTPHATTTRATPRLAVASRLAASGRDEEA